MYIEIEIDGEKILVETADNVEDAVEELEEKVIFSWEDLKKWFKSKIRKVSEFKLEKMTNIIRKFTKYVYDSCSNLEQIREPSEISIEFAMGFSITGDLFIAKSTVNSGIKVSMKWMNKERIT